MTWPWSWHEDDDERVLGVVPDVTVYEAENPVVGRLLGPDGRVLVEVRERATVRFGFTRRHT